ncbi:MAG: nucleotidyl transferase [Planctomycetes bacterium]|nr:nucleotidyl transferase [Planctomycetota bacterium]
MQAVILAGGLGTRLRPLTDTIPKAMVPVCGRPFLEYQIELLARCGVKDLIICLGHLGHMIEDHFGDGTKFGISIRYGRERHRLLGTAGAVKNVITMLRDAFFVVYGDSYAPVEFADVMAYFERHNRLGLMVVLRNEDRWDRSNVIVQDNLVAVYDKQQKLPGMDYIDHGVSLFRRKAFAFIPPGVVADLAVIHRHLVDRRELLAYETTNRFYQIGTPEGLAEFEALVGASEEPQHLLSSPPCTPANT